ncbi:MAG TPA: hypothetical protein VEQ42_07895, partial [Pyrinomonadaceae bacterium]|nr:hypothetical protein [Pyrinomonadaceae bacterium]
MKAALAAGSLVVVLFVLLASPADGAGALVLCALASALVLPFLLRAREDRPFLLQLFAAGLLLRLAVGTLINYFNLEGFFGGDAFTYDLLGELIVKVWHGELQYTV